MRTRNKFTSLAGCVALWPVFVLLGQTVPSQSTLSRTLPQGIAVKDNGPRTYRFTVDYNTANTKGEVIRRQRLTGEYTRGLAGGEVLWKNVSQADADGPTGPFTAAQKREFMEGFRYKDDPANTLKPDFFQRLSCYGSL